MADRPAAPTLRLELAELHGEIDAPAEAPPVHADADPEVRSAVARDSYDEQILAALVFP